jgi:hypothetical protein
MAYLGNGASDYTLTDDATAGQYLRDKLTAALTVQIEVISAYCMVAANTPYYVYYDVGYGVMGRVQGDTPVSVLAQSANGFAQVRLNVGDVWVKSDSIKGCLTQEDVNKQLAPAARKAVDEWWANQKVGPHWADQILNNQREFTAAINEINEFHLKPLLAKLPFFQEWKLV